MYKWLRLFIVFVVIVQASCKTVYENPRIEIQTGYGEIVIELYPEKAPKTVAAFLGYIEKGYYENSSFYRVLNNENQPSNAPKTELIQGGIWKSDPKRYAKEAGIPHEGTQQTGIRHTNGTLSLARQEPGSATTEFFICVADQPGLDYGGENCADKQGYAAFGRVVKGMNVVRKIYRQTETDQYFNPPVPIFSIERW